MAKRRKGMTMGQLARVRPGSVPPGHMAHSDEEQEKARMAFMDDTEAALREEAARNAPRTLPGTGEGGGAVAVEEAPQSPQEPAEAPGDSDATDNAPAADAAPPAASDPTEPPKRKRRKPPPKG